MRQTPRPAAALRHAEPAHAGVVLVDWMLGNACNHACSYCPAALHDGSVPWQRREDVIALMDRLAAHYAEGLGRSVWLQFTGGEPTSYPGFSEIMAESRARGFLQSVVSNGSRTLRFWKKAAGLLDSAILTYHDEFADHAAFLEVCRLLSDRLPLHVNVTMHPARFDAIRARAGEIAEAAPGASITLKPLRKGFGTALYDYSPAQLAQLSERVSRAPDPRATLPRSVMELVAEDGTAERWRANDLLVAGQNRWKGWRCEAGVESLRVKASGEILRAVCGTGGVIGRMGGPLTLPIASIRCSRDSCACVADILISKRRAS
ncbi:radical SAM protein [Poseidonocella sp. HB161398]|uniref:radical SAM protein n=1 Tax=Poseidonocella sp. HB161398 TaxID=2320855 RepID=UPI00197D9F2D|nr:radical SAM protein [Poseidonocella sp. HB161398]